MLDKKARDVAVIGKPLVEFVVEPVDIAGRVKAP